MPTAAWGAELVSFYCNSKQMIGRPAGSAGTWVTGLWLVYLFLVLTLFVTNRALKGGSLYFFDMFFTNSALRVTNLGSMLNCILAINLLKTRTVPI